MNCRKCFDNIERRQKAERAEKEANSLMCRGVANVMVLNDLVAALKAENAELRHRAGIPPDEVVIPSKKHASH